MKMIKMALLGGAALAVSAAGAQADDLTALKAQIESLNARVATMEAAPSVPAGYSLLSLGNGQATVVPGMTSEETKSFSGDVATVSVLPTADAPAGATIEWNGYVRSTLRFISSDPGQDETDLVYRGRLNMTAKTDTAVGEVGVRMRFEADGSLVDTEANVTMPVAWGWWAMTPELTLGGGYSGSLGNIGYGYDSCAVCSAIDNAPVYTNPGDASQMRLTYASGPLSMAIAIEDATGNNNWSQGAPDSEGFGAAAEIAYAGDSINGEISGVWRATDVGGGTTDSYNVGAGLGFGLGDMASISLAATMGQINDGSDYVTASILAHMDLTDAVWAELAAGLRDGNGSLDPAVGVMAGIYYAPVDQLTIGLEAEYVAIDDATNSEDIYGGLVAIWSF